MENLLWTLTMVGRCVAVLLIAFFIVELFTAIGVTLNCEIHLACYVNV